MPASLTALVDLRSRLAEDLLSYLDELVEELSTLPAYFPAHLRRSDVASGFDTIRQTVQVLEDREAFEDWRRAEALVSEQARAAGRSLSQRAYAPRRTRPEQAGDDDPRQDRRPAAERATPPPPPPVPWDEAAAKRFPQTVILADPGFGKTWLLKHEAIRLARSAVSQLRARRYGVEAIVVPIFVRLSELARSDDELEAALVRHVLARVRAASQRAGRQAPASHDAARAALAAYLATQLAQGRCAVLIDAWDEVPLEPVGDQGVVQGRPGTRQRQGERLRAFATRFHGPLRLTSRLVGYGGSLLPKAQEIELIALEPPQIEAFVGVWFPDSERRQALLTLFREQPTLHGLSRIPLMLTLLCQSFAHNGALPERRVDLYESCLHGLLRDWLLLDKHADREDPRLGDSYVEAMLDLLAGTAQALHTQGQEQFTEKQLAEAMRGVLGSLKIGHELYGRIPSSLIQELKRDGVLIAPGDEAPAYLFLHRTFQEYLTARELARQANLGPKRYAEITRDIAERLWWLPEWREVIVLLAGLVDDPLPLLNALAQKRGDDIARRRLALAGLALGEVDGERFGKSTALHRVRDAITTEAVELWRQHHRYGTEKLAQYVARSFPALARRDGRYYRKPLPDWITPALYQSIGTRFPRYRGVTLLDWIAAGLPERTADHKELLALLQHVGVATPAIVEALAELLHGSDRNVRQSAAKAVGRLGAAAATSSFLETLVRQMRDPDSGVRESAVWAVNELGPMAAMPSILEALAELLRDLDSGLRRSAVWAVGRLGASAATPEFRDALAGLMRHADSEVRERATEAVRKLGAAAATPPILEALTELLRDPNEHVRRQTAFAVGAMGAAAATPPILEALAERLRDPDDGVCAAAAEAVADLGAAATPLIPERLIEQLLQDWDEMAQGSAAQALHQLGMAVTPPILEALVERLRDTDEYVRRSAIRAVGLLGPAAATEAIVTALTPLLDEVVFMDHEYVEICSLGVAEITEPILTKLAAWLGEEGWGIRNSGLEKLRRLGPLAANDLICEALAAVLKDRAHAWWCSEAARTVGALGAGAARPPILAALLGALRHRPQEPRLENMVRTHAVYAVSKLGPAATTPAILEAMAGLLRDSDAMVREWTARAVGRLGTAAATFSILTALTKLLRDGSSQVRAEAANAITALLEDGVRFPIH